MPPFNHERPGCNQAGELGVVEARANVELHLGKVLAVGKAVFRRQVRILPDPFGKVPRTDRQRVVFDYGWNIYRRLSAIRKAIESDSVARNEGKTPQPA